MMTVQEIERAIQALSPGEMEELYAWLDQQYADIMDVRLPADLAAGRLDQAIDRALDDEKSGRTQPL